MAPLIIEFHGSSFLRKWTNVQSTVVNKHAQAAKFPAMIGDRCFIANKPPNYREIYLEILSGNKHNTNFSFVTNLSSSEAGRSISKAFYQLEYSTTDTSRGESSATIIDNSIWKTLLVIFSHRGSFMRWMSLYSWIFWRNKVKVNY